MDRPLFRRFATTPGRAGVLSFAALATGALLAGATLPRAAYADGIERKAHAHSAKRAAPKARPAIVAPVPAASQPAETEAVEIIPQFTEVQLADGFFAGNGGVGANVDGGGALVVAGGGVLFGAPGGLPSRFSGSFSGIGGVSILRAGGVRGRSR